MKKNKNVLFVEDRDSIAEITDLIRIHGYDITRVRDVREAIWCLEINPDIETDAAPYHAIILDATIPGCGRGYVVPGTDIERVIDHHAGANGYAYYRDFFIGDGAIPRLSSYAQEGRCAFYTAYKQEINLWAFNDGLNLDNVPLFEKGVKDLPDKICTWLETLPPIINKNDEK